MDLQERYGAPSVARRRALVATSVVLAVAFLGWLAWAALFHADPAVRSELVTRTINDDHAVTARIDVRLDQPDTVATCRLRAISEDHTVVGELSFEVTASDLSGGEVEQQIRTERRATTVELVGCTAEGQSRPQ